MAYYLAHTILVKNSKQILSTVVEFTIWVRPNIEYENVYFKLLLDILTHLCLCLDIFDDISTQPTASTALVSSHDPRVPLHALLCQSQLLLSWQWPLVNCASHLLAK